MPPFGAHPAPRPTVIAPDGIAIHAFVPPQAAGYLGVAEGRIPPGRFPIHRHLTIEQYTYVITGEIVARSGPAGGTDVLRAGDLLLTLPSESLQFENRSLDTARVLFICSPPYPADDSDTRLIPEHSAVSAAERRDAVARLEQLRARFNAEIDSRIAQLRTA